MNWKMDIGNVDKDVFFNVNFFRFVRGLNNWNIFFFRLWDRINCIFVILRILRFFVLLNKFL